MADRACAHCGAPETVVSIGDLALCDPGSNREVARITGLPELPEPPGPVVIKGPDGERHKLRFRVWRAPTGVVVDLHETGLENGEEGFEFSGLGGHDANVDELVAHVRQSAEAEIATQYLERNPRGWGWILRGDEVAGRLVWSEGRGAGDPYDVVVDGRAITWEELGSALESYEGWRFRLVIEDHSDDLRPDAEVIALSDLRAEEAAVTSDQASSATIDEVLREYLAEEEKRLAPRTFARYQEVIWLLCDSLNGYGPNSLDDDERGRWEAAYDADPEAFVHLFGPAKIAENLGEFLGYFMIHKVMGGEDLMRSAGTVTKKLSKWLGQRGYLDADVTTVAVDRGSDAARELPQAARLSRLLYEGSARGSIDVHALNDDDYEEDYLTIEKIEPGFLWFDRGIGPVKVLSEASEIAEEGWSVSLVLGRVDGIWHVIEAGNVYP